MIPDELMSRLHEANEQFSRANRRLEGLEQLEPNERTDLGAALRAAEKELEDVTREINLILGTPEGESSQPPPAGSA